MSAIYNACKRGDVTQVKLLISQGAINYDFGLRGACRGGHRELVDLMLMLGATEYNGGLWGACKGGHREIAVLMLARGATNYRQGLWCACENDHLDIALLVINKGGRLLSESLGAISQLLNFGLDPKSGHISTNQYVKQKVIERQCVLNNAEKILTNYIPQDIIHHVISIYVRYE
jgi:hypothetical protein